MIREYQKGDVDAVIDIWLDASLRAHDFVEPAFWASQVESMRTSYLPAAENYVYELEEKVVGFYSLHDNNLAAIFVKPELQGQGIGKQLLSHAKRQRPLLTLAVYKENQPSYQFYLSQGFVLLSEQVDEHTGHQAYQLQFAHQEFTN